MHRVAEWLRFFGAFAVFLTWQRVTWFLGGVVTAFVMWSFLEPTWEERIRLAGGTLECFGLVTVAHSLYGKRSLFRQADQPGALAMWWSSRPRPPQAVISGSVMVSLGSASLSAAGTAATIVATSSLDDRLSHLEKAVEDVRRELQQMTRETTVRAQELDAAVTREVQARQNDVRTLRAHLEKAVAGGLKVEGLGVIWLFIGIPLATAPGEIAQLFGVS